MARCAGGEHGGASLRLPDGTPAETPAVAGRESEDAMETLLYLTEVTGDRRFLEPLPDAIAWLKRSILPDGKIARFYELETNRPLYFTKDEYELTYDDSNLPTHYSFKSNSRVSQFKVGISVSLHEAAGCG